MENRHLIEAYRQERRALEIPNYVREDLGSVVRYSPNSSDSQGIVCFTRIPEADLADEIRRQIAWFESRNLAFEWKVYDSDEPRRLKSDLLEAGFEEGEPEALLHGGAVLPAFRGRGIYSRLFEARMMDALARGLKWVAVDAAPMSRPILEAKGFERLDSTWPMVWSPGVRA